MAAAEARRPGAGAQGLRAGRAAAYGHGSRTLPRRGKGGVEVAGLPSELVLFCYGREQAEVELIGDEESIATLKAADKGL